MRLCRPILIHQTAITGAIFNSWTHSLATRPCLADSIVSFASYKTLLHNHVSMNHSTVLPQYPAAHIKADTPQIFQDELTLKLECQSLPAAALMCILCVWFCRGCMHEKVSEEHAASLSAASQNWCTAPVFCIRYVPSQPNSLPVFTHTCTHSPSLIL